MDLLGDQLQTNMFEMSVQLVQVANAFLLWMLRWMCLLLLLLVGCFLNNQTCLGVPNVYNSFCLGGQTRVQTTFLLLSTLCHQYLVYIVIS